MNIKHILALGLGIITLHMSASTATKRMKPSVRVYTESSWFGGSTNVKIVISGLDEFKGNDFEINIDKDCRGGWIKGESYSRKDAYGNKYRYKFNIHVKFPVKVRQWLVGKNEYHNTWGQFSYYNHKWHTSITITLPAA